MRKIIVATGEAGVGTCTASCGVSRMHYAQDLHVMLVMAWVATETIRAERIE